MPVHDKNMHGQSATVREYVHFHVVAATTATVANVGGFVVQKDCFFERVGARAKTVSGTSPTLRADFMVGSPAVLKKSAPNVTAGGLGNGQQSVVDSIALKIGDVASIDLTIGGTTPSFADIDVWVVLRTGGRDVEPGFDLTA